MISVAKKQDAGVLGLLRRSVTLYTTCCVLLIFAGCSSKWTITGHLNDARSGHTATRLHDGTVLVTGGLTETTVLASTERYSPATGKWTRMAPMNVPRARHTATLLSDGAVLVTGGYEHIKDFYPINSTERYNPTTNTWTLSKSMHRKRGFHLAVLVSGNRVVVIGSGPNVSVDDQRSVEMYDVDADSWTEKASSKLGHTRGTASLQPDGSIIVAGGAEMSPGLISLIVYAERYSPANDA